MAKFYYDKWECIRINNLSKTDPYNAKKLYELYFQKYPDDSITYLYYAMLLITLNEINKAEAIVNEIEDLAKNNELVFKSENKLSKFNRTLIYAKLKVLSYKSKYAELLYYYLSHFEEIKDEKLAILPFYCRSKLGMLESTNRENNLYVYRQIIQYKISDFYDHIQKHLADYNNEQKKINKSIFSVDFDVDQVISEVNKHIPSAKRVFPTFITDNYLFRFDSCGRENYKNTDFFEVVTFHNSNKMVTMFPTRYYKNIDFVDLNYLKNEQEVPYIRTRKQIDKFNQKYNLK